MALKNYAYKIILPNKQTNRYITTYRYHFIPIA